MRVLDDWRGGRPYRNLSMGCCRVRKITIVISLVLCYVIVDLTTPILEIINWCFARRDFSWFICII